MVNTARIVPGKETSSFLGIGEQDHQDQGETLPPSGGRLSSHPRLPRLDVTAIPKVKSFLKEKSPQSLTLTRAVGGQVHLGYLGTS